MKLLNISVVLLFVRTINIYVENAGMIDLSRNEELILLAVWRLKDNAYGVTIRKDVVSVTGSELHYGSMYNTLDLLMRKGLVTCSVSTPESKRGGRRKKLYQLSGDGIEALGKLQNLQKSAWNGVPDLVK